MTSEHDKLVLLIGAWNLCDGVVSRQVSLVESRLNIDVHLDLDALLKHADDAAVLLNQYVVTGSVAPRTKMESPVAITTLDRTKVDELAPRNLGEMLKAVPGIYVESTGGEAFNNVSIRGFGVTSGFGAVT